MADENTTTTETTTAPAESTAADAATETSTEAASTGGPAAEATTAAGAAQAIKDAPQTAEGAAEVAEAIANAPAETVEALQALAKKLGFEFDGAAVALNERKGFREHQRKQREVLQRERQAIIEEINAERGKYSSEVDKARMIIQANETNDFEGLAKALGHESWEGLQKNVMARLADPHYKELQELKQWQAEQEREKAEGAKRYHEQQQQRAKAEQRRTYLNRLSAQMANSENPLVAAFHDDPSFVAHIEKIQLENWDDERRQTVTPERAIAIAARQGGSPMTAYMRGLYDKLHSVFGETGAAPTNGSAATAPPVAAKPTKTGGKTQVVKGAAVEASPAVDATDPKFTDNWIKAMEAAAERDRAEGKGLGAG